MSTRSYIGVQQKDGTIKGVYCHSDGYPSHNGALLLEYYNSEEMANKLVSLGDLSLLQENLEPSKEYDKPLYDWRCKGDVKHSFDSPQNGVTIAYHRDRNEKLNITIFKDEDSFYAEDTFIDYNYLFKDGNWYIDKELLTEDLIKEN